MRITIAGALVALSITSIGADDAAAQDAPWRGIPTFATLDRGDGDSLVGIDLGYLAFEDGGPDRALRFDLHGQYVARSGIGGYATLPITSVKFADDGGDFAPESATGVGALELGGLWVTPQDPRFSLVLRGGLALPTGSDENDGVQANLAGWSARLTDFALLVPETTWIRLGVSPLLRHEVLFVRVDLGVDVPLTSDVDAEPIVRANVGVGVDPGPVAVTAEIATVVNALGGFEEEGEDLEDVHHTLAVAGRYIGGSVQPSLAIGLPLDESLREGLYFFAIVGVQGLF